MELSEALNDKGEIVVEYESEETGIWLRVWDMDDLWALGVQEDWTWRVADRRDDGTFALLDQPSLHAKGMLSLAAVLGKEREALLQALDAARETLGLDDDLRDRFPWDELLSHALRTPSGFSTALDWCQALPASDRLRSALDEAAADASLTRFMNDAAKQRVAEQIEALRSAWK